MGEGFSGRSMLLKIGDAASPEVFTAIGGIQTKSVSVNNNPVDVSDDSASYQKMLSAGGIQAYEISGSGVSKSSAQFLALKAAAAARSELNYQITNGLGDTVEGMFVITSFEETGGHTDAQTFNISLSSGGAITYTAPS